jgi:hypothetical protein
MAPTLAVEEEEVAAEVAEGEPEEPEVIARGKADEDDEEED